MFTESGLSQESALRRFGEAARFAQSHEIFQPPQVHREDHQSLSSDYMQTRNATLPMSNPHIFKMQLGAHYTAEPVVIKSRMPGCLHLVVASAEDL